MNQIVPKLGLLGQQCLGPFLITGGVEEASCRSAFLPTWLTSWSPPGSRKLQDRESEEVPISNCIIEPTAPRRPISGNIRDNKNAPPPG